MSDNIIRITDNDPRVMGFTIKLLNLIDSEHKSCKGSNESIVVMTIALEHILLFLNDAMTNRGLIRVDTDTGTNADTTH